MSPLPSWLVPTTPKTPATPTVPTPKSTKAVGVAKFWTTSDFKNFVKSSGTQTVETPIGTAFGWGAGAPTGGIPTDPINLWLQKFQKSPTQKKTVEEIIAEANAILPKDESGRFPRLSQDLRYGDTLFLDDSTAEITGNPKDPKTTIPLFWTPDVYDPTKLVWGTTDTGKPVILDEKTAQNLNTYYSTFIDIDPNLVKQREILTQRELDGYIPKTMLDTYYASRGVTYPGTRWYFFPEDLIALKNIESLPKEQQETAMMDIFKRAKPFTAEEEPSLWLKIGETGDVMKQAASAGAQRGRLISKFVADFIHALAYTLGVKLGSGNKRVGVQGLLDIQSGKHKEDSGYGSGFTNINQNELSKSTYKWTKLLKDPAQMDKVFNFSNLSPDKQKVIQDNIDNWNKIIISGTEQEKQELADKFYVMENLENFTNVRMDVEAVFGSLLDLVNPEAAKDFLAERGVSSYRNTIASIDAEVSGGKYKRWEDTGFQLLTQPEKIIENYQMVAEEAAPVHTEAYRIFKLGGLDNQKLAIDMLVKSYGKEYAALPTDPSASWEWIGDPERRDYFFTIAAQLELQSHSPLNRNEMRQLINTIADPGSELIGGYAIDLNNFLNLPIGGIATEMVGGTGSNAYKALGFGKIPNFPNAQIDSLAVSLTWNKVIKPLFKAGGEAFTNSALGKFAFGALHLDTIFKKSAKSVARALAQDAENIFKLVSSADKMILDSDALVDISSRVTTYGMRISALKAGGYTIDDILDIIKKEMVNSGDATLATDKIVRSISSMVDTIDPLKSNWGKIIAKNFDDAKSSALLTEIVRQKTNPDVQRMVRDLEEVAKSGTIADKKALDDLYREIVERAKVVADTKITPTVISRMFGNVFDGAYLEANKAWEGTSILKGTFSAWLGSVLPVSKFKKIDGVVTEVTESLLHGTVQGWNDVVYKTYRKMMDNLVNKWLYMTGRFPSYQQMENASSYALMHGTGTVADRVGDILSFGKNVDTPSMSLAQSLAEIRYGSYGLKGSDIGGNVISEVEREKELMEKAFGWIVSPISVGSNFKDSFQAAKLQIIQDMMDAGLKIDPKTMTADELHHAQTIINQKMPWAIKTAWIDSIKDQTSFMETSYRALMAGKIIDENMNLLDSAAMSANLSNLKNSLIAGGLSQSNVDAIMESAELAWKRSYGNPDIFERLMDVQGMLKGTSLNSAWIPDELLKNATPEDMIAYRKIEAEWDGYIRTLKDKGEIPTLENVRSFFKEVSNRVTGLAEEAHNPDGLYATSILGVKEGKPALSASLSNLLNEYKSAGGDISQLKGIPTKDATKIIKDNKILLKGLDIKTAGRSNGDILADLAEATGGIQKVASIAITPWSKLVRDLSENFDEYPDELISGNKWALRNKVATMIRDDGTKIKAKDFANLSNDNQVKYIQAIAKSEGDELSDILAQKTVLDVNNKLGITDYVKNQEYVEFENSQIRSLSKSKAVSKEHAGRVNELFSNVEGVDNDMAQFRATTFPGTARERSNTVVDRKLYKTQYEPAWNLDAVHQTEYLRRKGDYLETVRNAIENGTSIPNVTRSQMWEWYGFTNPKVDNVGNIIGIDLIDKDSGLATNSFGQVKVGKFGDEMVDSPTLSLFKQRSRMSNAVDLEYSILRPFPDIVDEATPFAKTATEVTVTSKKPTGYPKGTSIKITPLADETMEQALARERKAFVTAIIEHEEWGTQTPKYYVQKILTPTLNKVGKKLDDLSPEEIVDEIRKLANIRATEGLRHVPQSLTDLADKIAYDIEQFNSMAVTGRNIPTPIVMARLPDDLRAWSMYRMNNLAELESFQASLKTWEKFIGDKLGDDTLMKILKIDPTDMGKVNLAVGEAAQGMAKTRDAVLYGGEIAGQTVEGAVPKMNVIMKNYTTSATNFDEFMKTMFPFWMFPRSAALAWTRLIADNPTILTLYNKYIRYSYAHVTSNGMVDSKGQALKSYVGKVPIMKINGRNIWIEAFPGLPIRYIYNSISAKQPQQDEQADVPIVQQVFGFISREGEARGLRMGLLAEIITSALSGTPDRYTGQGAVATAASYGIETALPIPKELIPPFLTNFIGNMLKKVGMPSIGDAVDPQVTWFDSVVEGKLLTQLLADIQSRPGDTKYAFERAAEVRDILMNPKREGIPEWDKYAMETKNDDFYNKNLVGFVSGFYPRYMSDDDMSLYALRNKLNFLRDAANNLLGTSLFAIMPNEARRQQLYNNERYDTPEGYVWGLRQNTQFVKDEYTDEVITDPGDRRNRMAQLYSEDIQTEEYYAEMERVAEVRDAKLKALPIGDADAMFQVYSEWGDTRTQLEKFYPMAQRAWSKGYKPVELVYNHYSSLWWQLIRETKPKYDIEHGMKYDEYQINMDEWIDKTLPILGKSLATTFMLNIEGGGEDSVKITNQLLAETNRKGWEAYQVNSDDIFEALLRGWETLYLDPFYVAMEGKESYAYQLAEQQWLVVNKQPTPSQLYDFIIKTYGKDKWTKDDVYNAMTVPTGEPRMTLDVPQKQQTGKDEREKQFNDIKEWYSWANVATKLSQEKKPITFSAVFKKNGGDANALNTLWGVVSPYSFSNVAEFDKLYEIALKTKEDMQLQPPDAQGLGILAKAQSENDKLGQLLTRQFGAAWKDTFTLYEQQTKADKKAWQKQNPEKFAQYVEYTKIKKQFALEYPDWAEYYGGKYVSSVGASSEGSTPLVRANYGGGATSIPKATVTSMKLFGAPLRTGTNLASLGFSGDFSKVAGEWLLNEISIAAGGTRKLSKAALTRLRNMQGIYPSLSREIGAIIAKYS